MARVRSNAGRLEALSDTFAGIAPASVSAFIAAQLVGAGMAALFFGWLFQQERAT